MYMYVHNQYPMLSPLPTMTSSWLQGLPLPLPEVDEAGLQIILVFPTILGT